MAPTVAGAAQPPHPDFARAARLPVVGCPRDAPQARTSRPLRS